MDFLLLNSMAPCYVHTKQFKNVKFPWLVKKNSLILWWQFLHPLDVSKSLETPINKGFWSSSKNYEFETISAITVPTLIGCKLLLFLVDYKSVP